MERLIDADLLIKELKGCTCTDKHDERIIKEFVVHIVKQQPTAFDVEAVMNELYEKIQHVQCNKIELPYDVVAVVKLSEAIKIVRKGGVR